MHLDVPISLTRFGWTSLEERASADGFDVAEMTEQACANYASELDRGRLATRLPKAGADQPAETERLLGLELDDRCAEILESEARRQGVPFERLVRHATLLYLADLDAGRVAGKIAEGVEERESDPVR
jgi:hypothetical protein